MVKQSLRISTGIVGAVLVLTLFLARAQAEPAEPAAQAEPASPAPTKGSQSASQAAQGSIFSSKEREPAQAAERQTAPGSAGSS